MYYNYYINYLIHPRTSDGQPRKPAESGPYNRDQERFERPPPAVGVPPPRPASSSSYPLGAGARLPPQPPKPEAEPEAETSSFFDFIPFFGKKPSTKPLKPQKQQPFAYGKQQQQQQQLLTGKQQLPPPPGPRGPPKPQQPPQFAPINGGQPLQLPEKRIDTEENSSGEAAGEDKPFIVTAERVLPAVAAGTQSRPLAPPPVPGGQFGRPPSPPRRPLRPLSSQPVIGLPPAPPTIKQTPFSPKQRPLVPPQLPAFPTAGPPLSAPFQPPPPQQQRRPLVAASREAAGEIERKKGKRKQDIY